jgi:predicted oxidoreductase
MNFLGTLGGIKINEKTEALDRNDKVIPGLYAVGNDAGGTFIHIVGEQEFASGFILDVLLKILAHCGGSCNKQLPVHHEHVAD